MYVRILTTAPSPHLCPHTCFNGQTVFGVNPPQPSHKQCTLFSGHFNARCLESNPNPLQCLLFFIWSFIVFLWSTLHPPTPQNGRYLSSAGTLECWESPSPYQHLFSKHPPNQHTHTHTSSLFASLLLFSGHFMVLGNCHGVQLPHSKSNVLAVVRTRTQNVEDRVLKVCQHNVALQVGENSC